MGNLRAQAEGSSTASGSEFEFSEDGAGSGIVADPLPLTHAGTAAITKTARDRKFEALDEQLATEFANVHEERANRCVHILTRTSPKWVNQGTFNVALVIDAATWLMDPTSICNHVVTMFSQKHIPVIR